MFIELRFSETSPLGGKVLIHSADEQINSMSMIRGIALNGKVCLLSQTLLLATQL